MDRVLQTALEKFALTRSVKEWRGAQATGNTQHAAQIAQGAAQLNLAPRHVADVSGGGAEAGVDRMIGAAGAQQQAQAPSLQQRFQQYQANKQQLGLQGRAPSAGAMQAPQGRAALLRNTAPAPAPAAPNQTGDLARKLYKPDSPITRGQYTGELLDLKQTTTDQMRALSPEAKAMVPAMYGHQNVGTQQAPQYTSQHEWVPGMSDLHAAHGDEGIMDELHRVHQTVVAPMAAKGYSIGDTVGNKGGYTTFNPGNVVHTPEGTKIVDSLPGVIGQTSPQQQSFRANNIANTFDPVSFTRRHTEGAVDMNKLRREVYNPSGALPHEVDYSKLPQRLPPVAPAAPAQPAVPSTRPVIQTMPTALSPKMASVRSSFLDELQKIAHEAKTEKDKKSPTGPKAMKVYREIAKQYPDLVQSKLANVDVVGAEKGLAGFLRRHDVEDRMELLGLGTLGTIGADRIQAHLRAGRGASDEDIEKKQLLGETGHAALDTAGLGILAAPYVAKAMKR